MTDSSFRFEDITVRFGGIDALSGICLELPAGSIYGILGPNGAGKTTLFNVASGLQKPDAGSVVLRGRDITRLPTYARASLGLARTFQITNMFPSLTAMENILLATLRSSEGRNNMWKAAHKQTDARDGAIELLDALQLSHRAHSYVKDIGYGQRRQLEIAMALACAPSVLLLDEPTAGLSIAETDAVVKLIKNSASGLTVLVIEHDLGVVFDLVDYIAVLDNGKMVANGSVADVRDSTLFNQVYLGSDGAESAAH